jgi:hypothetical protein
MMLGRKGAQWWIAALVIAGLMLASIPLATPAMAATAIIGRFYATCSSFAVDAAVNGNTDDGSGLDRFRYLISDNTGKKLYSEDATRPINNTQGRVVTNVSYDADGIADGPPIQNPIKLQIIDLNNVGAVIGTIFQMSYDAKCLPASGSATFAGEFQPPALFKARINVTTPLLVGPGGAQIGSLVAEAGKEFIAVYKSADSLFISIFVGGSDLPWIVAGAAGVDLAGLPVQPTRIETAGAVVGGVPPGAPTATPFPGVIIIGTPTPVPVVLLPPSAITAFVRTRLRLRALPNTRAAVLLTIPTRAIVPVYGRSADNIWVKVGYNGRIGWVAVRFVRLSGAQLFEIPVVQ